jgi:SAM-dependent methyltransferase
MDAKELNLQIYEASWGAWMDMKRFGPASRWLRSLVRDVLAHCVDAPPTAILDVGCGEGTNTAMLADLFPVASVFGIDQSKEAIRLGTDAYGRSRLTFGVVELSGIPSASYDLVTCMEVLEHVDDWQAFLAQLVAATGRDVMLSFPTGRMRPFEVNVGHVRNLQPGEIERALAALGFAPVHTVYAGFPFYSPIYREICQLTDAGASGFSRGRYGWSQHLVARLFYFLFRYCSSRRRHGDQFVGLFRRVAAAGENGPVSPPRAGSAG